MKRLDLVGKPFGRWTVLEDLGNRKKASWWLCECSCGTIRAVLGHSLTTEDGSRSCGCLTLESVSKHGRHNTPEYLTWCSMHSRCECESNPAYGDYGERGIYICDRWKEFAAFFEDMGVRPPGTSLDRVDNDGPYSKENCRWATQRQQTRNTRGNRLITICGITKPLVEWAEIYGHTTSSQYRTVHGRLDRLGWSPLEALSKPTGRGRWA